MFPDTNLYPSLQKLQTVCLNKNIPFVSYRLPLQSEITTLVQPNSIPVKLNSLQSIDNENGFIIAPFVENKSNSTYLLQPDFEFCNDEIEDVFIQDLNLNDSLGFNNDFLQSHITSTLEVDFINQVNTAVRAIDNAEFHKVVLSKVRVEDLKDDFVASHFFQKLCSKYPHAFVYIVQIPQVGCWIGATPEPLLVVENDSVKTVSLAGTQIGTDAEIDTYNWALKEIDEQNIVTSFVEQTLQNLDIKKYTKTGPENYRAANLIHLKSSLLFAQADLKNRLGEFITALHPTPSVGGLPKKEAREFILKNEKHNRAYYTGFLGPINIKQKSHVFVNLRCLQLFDKQFVLYSGAGITSSSIAEKEWEETDNKMMTMMNVINS